MMDSNLFLLGLPGSGKSTLGRSLAEKLGYSFFDLDEEIAAREGKSIPDFIKFQGEGNFRIREKELLHELCSKETNFVLATGGGTPCFHFNIDFMNNHGTSVYLDVSPGDLALRIMDQGMEKRPLLMSYDQMDLIQELRDLKEKRTPFYNQAKIKVSNNQITIDMIIAKLNDQ